ncbi:Anti-sigma factor N-terminus [Anaerobranca californiensis DSM 14826]|jgi:phosphoribosylformimino-5-aminoimidazole carboxamide ribonucleotide (ProFAR) isomerase|uniref:Anti-sigma factor N-terminus n=1 Tax=Anaerobranca californiensis DSM 14826 TaxID=1120989 RepID=A0A1M6QIG9_9FIRM|nr:anti-sigma factor domain-containing protein [Anaerobranca californiensis]SHK19996.1 Anti-sigma factor N-terminus [Anaerobranca californiensis DSM 14826]
MKKVVLETKGKEAILLQEDGTFIKVKNKNYKIGDKVEVKSSVFNKKTILSLAASILFFLIVGGGVFAYNYPYYYVSLDVNPGILLTSNIFNRVIEATAINEEGEKILEDLKIKNRAIEEVIEKTILKLSREYLQEGNADLLISYVSRGNDIKDKRIDRINEIVEKTTEGNGIKGNVTIEVTGYEMVQKAKEAGITPGKYNLITNLLNEEITEENKNSSVSDLMKRFTEEIRNRQEERRENTNREDNGNREENLNKNTNDNGRENSNRNDNQNRQENENRKNQNLNTNTEEENRDENTPEKKTPPFNRNERIPELPTPVGNRR